MALKFYAYVDEQDYRVIGDIDASITSGFSVATNATRFASTAASARLELGIHTQKVDIFTGYGI